MALTAGTARTVPVGVSPVLVFQAAGAVTACDVTVANPGVIVWASDRPDVAPGMGLRLVPGQRVQFDHSTTPGIPGAGAPARPYESNQPGAVWLAAPRSRAVVTVTPYTLS